MSLEVFGTCSEENALAAVHGCEFSNVEFGEFPLLRSLQVKNKKKQVPQTLGWIEFS